MNYWTGVKLSFATSISLEASLRIGFPKLEIFVAWIHYKEREAAGNDCTHHNTFFPLGFVYSSVESSLKRNVIMFHMKRHIKSQQHHKLVWKWNKISHRASLWLLHFRNHTSKRRKWLMCLDRSEAVLDTRLSLPITGAQLIKRSFLSMLLHLLILLFFWVQITVGIIQPSN